MAHVLDNAVWHSIDGPRRAHADIVGLAGRFHRDVAPFAAVCDDAPAEAWRDLVGLSGSSKSAMLFAPLIRLPDEWVAIPDLRFPGLQLVAENVAAATDADDGLVDLGPPDVPEVLDLIAATRPGPFSARTVELGGYVGYRVAGRLVAMGGERLRCAGYTEISAVCTAADHRGRGLGTSIVLALVASIRARGEEAFLHVAATNTGAIRLYEALGFVVRCEVDAVGIRHTG